jgi:hypothetical protein
MGSTVLRIFQYLLGFSAKSMAYNIEICGLEKLTILHNVNELYLLHLMKIVNEFSIFDMFRFSSR